MSKVAHVTHVQKINRKHKHGLMVAEIAGKGEGERTLEQVSGALGLPLEDSASGETHAQLSQSASMPVHQTDMLSIKCTDLFSSTPMAYDGRDVT